MRIHRFILVALIIIMGQMLLAQNVQISVSPASLKPGEKGTISATLSIPAGKHQSHDPSDTEYFNLIASHPQLSFGKTIFPKADKVISPTEWEYHGKVTLKLPFTVKANAKAGKTAIEALFNYNLCFDNGMCEPPEEKETKLNLEILAAADPDKSVESSTEAEAEAEQDSVSAIANPTNPAPVDSAETKSKKDSQSKFPPIYFLFAFLGGMILNITPCVLPILPIRIMAIVNQAHKDRSKVLLHTLIYTLGVLISFAVLAGIFIGLRSAGEQLSWGFQNQNPMFTVVLMSIVFAFALSLLDVFVLTAPGMNTASRATAKTGYSGSFFGGIFAFLMAISCTGPLMGAALPYAFKLSSPLLMVFFLLIGLGFAMPFILIGLIPAALKIIPKPGEWMNIFKEVMGFVLLYLVFTMLKTTLALTSGAYLMNVVFFLLVLGFALWMYGRFVRMENSRITQWVFSILALAFIVGGGLHFLPLKPEYLEAQTILQANADGLTPAPHAPAGWYVFSPEIHKKMLDQGKAVFLDIGADWCKNCMTNEKTVLFTPEIMKDFEAAGVTLLRGDFTRKDEVLLKWIQDHGRMGVPFNALYIPGKEPILFPELLSAKRVRDALKEIPGDTK